MSLMKCHLYVEICELFCLHLYSNIRISERSKNGSHFVSYFTVYVTINKLSALSNRIFLEYGYESMSCNRWNEKKVTFPVPFATFSTLMLTWRSRGHPVFGRPSFGAVIVTSRVKEISLPQQVLSSKFVFKFW
jgi:hypothetical protein